MRIHHVYPHVHSRNTVETDCALFLRSPKGPWLYSFTTPQTRYEGWHVPYGDSFLKLLERVVPVDGNPVTDISRTLTDYTLRFENGAALTWTLTDHGWGAQLANPSQQNLAVILDIRHMYSTPEFGRSYELFPEPKGVLVRYTDPILKRWVYLHVQTTRPFEIKGTWKEASYPRDTARHSFPNHLYTYILGETKGNLIFFGAGLSEAEARQASKAASHTSLDPQPIGISHSHNHLINEITAATASVEQSLSYLKSPKGLFAGLPWFHQVWSRDELIAALGLPPTEQLTIIERYLSVPLVDGELPTFVGSNTTCADGVGWLALLIREYGLRHLTPALQGAARHFFQTARTQLQESRMSNHGFIQSGHNATWMDTIGRSGYILEIQCMYGLVLELLATLTNETVYEQERIALMARIRNHYLYGGYLRDTLNDPAKRPNVFFAYLLQPDLLPAKLWIACFDSVLGATRCAWGGLSSIDQSHPLFQRISTGEDNVSYHNGDSWFFVNNLAAMAMHRLDAGRYGRDVMDIVQSSTNETLWQHMIGMPGEIASASTGESWGCGIQAFSGGTYLALLNDLENYGVEQGREAMASFWDATAFSKSDNFLS